MRFYFWICYFIFFINCSESISAQFNPHNFNQKLLEHQIKILIDSTRNAHQLPPLFNDSILYVASRHHAEYLVKKGILSHEETGSKTCYSPQDRAYYYGASKSYLVGENLVYTPYNSSVKVKGKIFQTENYLEIARSMVYAWINSKGHFKNIITPDYQVTGLAISIDTIKQRIYACQKFAKVMYTYSFLENKTFFPYSTLTGDEQTNVQTISNEYPFKLRADETETCEECRKIWENYPGLSVRVQNNNFILRVEDADFVKSLIQNKFDGFAIEIMPFDPFACGNPAYNNEDSRRNGKKKTSGQILEPIYRNELVKGFKKRIKVKNINFVNYIFSNDSVSFFKRFGRYKLAKFNAKYFEIKLGKVPKDLKGWWNHNLTYIHNKQICHFVYLTSYPGELVTELMEVAYFPPIPINNYEFKLEYFTDTLELFYQSGKTISNGLELPQLIQKFEKQNLKITNIQIHGYCSVEGDSLINNRLHQQRAENILNNLKPLTDSTTKFEVKSQTAWSHFYENVSKLSKWQFLFPQSQIQISKYLSNKKNEQPIEILNQERKVIVIIHAVKEFSPNTANYYVSRDISNFFYKDSKQEIICSDYNKLQLLYEKAYYLTTVDTLSKVDFLKITFPKLKIPYSHSFEKDIAFYKYHLNKESIDGTKIKTYENEISKVFDMCGAADHLSAEFHYLSACLLVDKIQQDPKKNTANTQIIQKAFDRLNSLLSSYTIDSVFYLNVSIANLNIINTICSTIGPEKIYDYTDIINKSLIQIIEFYRRTNQLDAKKVIELSKLLCYFNNISMAVDLCSDFLDNNDVLKIYFPLAYIHSSYLTGENELIFEKEYQLLLLESKKRLSVDEWCSIFYGDYGIPFQIMDSAPLHEQFCTTCPNRVNELFDTK
ncbi:MAG: CAP domain-containing protein [Flavobacteriia bacterium]|nr:CAP domain-containing protein [Flavobacteriia bacterium]